MLSSPPFPHPLLWLYSDFSSALILIFFPPCCYFSPLPLFLLVFLSFHLQSTHLYSFFCFDSCLFLALHLFFSPQSCGEIIFLLRENQSVRTHELADLLPPTHTHTKTHTLHHTHIKRTAIEKICSRAVYNAPEFICACSFAGCQDGLISVGACRLKSTLRCYKYYRRGRKK